MTLPSPARARRAVTVVFVLSTFFARLRTSSAESPQLAAESADGASDAGAPPPALEAADPGATAPARDEPKKTEAKEAKKEEHWYDHIRLRGYTQLRYNRLYASNDDLKFDSSLDRSVGKDNGFFLRRARLIVQVDYGFVTAYLQSDFSGALGSFGDGQNFAQIRDWYADLHLDHDKEFRIRAGQSKVPYGFEGPQSSSNRASLDRTDAINTGAPSERDIGVYAMYAPASVRRLFRHLVDDGLKGSGDYGMITVGAYNGQGTNLKEKNDDKHVLARVSVPFQIGEQIVEAGASGYMGKHVVSRDPTVTGNGNYLDRRVAAHAILYPQPIGAQVEYNVGQGPELQGSDVRSTRPLEGGYAMLLARFGNPDTYGVFVPYVRGTYYDGGRKVDVNSPRNRVREVEGGLEWELRRRIELTVAWNESWREINGKAQAGSVLRLQLQFNY